MEQLLREAGLKVLATDGKYLQLDHGYRIEIEHEQLFKLTHEGAVIAPFDDGPELVRFILADMQLNNLH